MIAKGRNTNIPEILPGIPEWNEWRALATNFGIGCMNVTEAAELISIDMWTSGELPDIAEPLDWDGDEQSPTLLSALAPVVSQMQARILAAIDNGRLEADLLRRDLDERILPQQTLIHHQDLTAWLYERGYELGDVLDDWVEVEDQALRAMCDEAEYLESQRKRGKRGGWAAARALARARGRAGNAGAGTNCEELLVAYKALVVEHTRVAQHHPRQNADHETRPVSTRERQSLLCIIAALAREADIDLKARGAAARVSALTECIGSPIGEDTVKKFLNQLDDALERRAK